MEAACTSETFQRFRRGHDATTRERSPWHCLSYVPIALNGYRKVFIGTKRPGREADFQSYPMPGARIVELYLLGMVLS
jgi:hypothetical protein